MLALPGLASAQARPATNLVTHSLVTIARPAAVVWPYILDPNEWKQGAKLWHHSGPPGQEGEVFAAGDPAMKAKILFFVENVELVPAQRRTIKIYEPGGTLAGFATWTVRSDGNKTLVGYDVYSETRIDAGQANRSNPAERQAAERRERQTNQQRFDRELVELKRLVEANHR
jgi:hypothetical protein